MSSYQIELRRNIAKRKCELELDSLKLYELTIHEQNIRNDLIKQTTRDESLPYRKIDYTYALSVAANNTSMAQLEVRRHKIEIKEMESKLDNSFEILSGLKNILGR